MLPESPLSQLFGEALVRWAPEMSVIFYEYAVSGTRFRLDFALPHLRRGCELDGYVYHEGLRRQGRSKATEDKQRERVLDRAGWKLTRFSGDEVRAAPDHCAREWLVICGITPLEKPRVPVCDDCGQDECDGGQCWEVVEEMRHEHMLNIMMMGHILMCKAERLGLIGASEGRSRSAVVAQQRWAEAWLDAGYKPHSCSSDEVCLAYLNESDEGGGMQFGPFIACSNCPLFIPLEDDGPDWEVEEIVAAALRAPGGTWEAGIKGGEPRYWWLDLLS